MAESDLPTEREARIREHVSEVLRRSPSASYYEVLERWRASRDQPVDDQEADLIRQAYDEIAGSTSAPSDLVAVGVVLGFALHLLQIPLAMAVGWLACREDTSGYCALAAFAPILLIGVSQLLYMGPAIGAALIWRRSLVKGLLIAAGFTALLNAACYAGLGGMAAGI